MAKNDLYGHLGVAEVSENGPNEFPMAQNLGIDTKIKSLACLEAKLQILPFSPYKGKYSIFGLILRSNSYWLKMLQIFWKFNQLLI